MDPQPAAPQPQPMPQPGGPAPASYIPPPVPPPAQPADPPKYSAGGWLGQFDWVEIGFAIIGMFGVYTVIDYYRSKKKSEATTLTAVKQQADDMAADLARTKTKYKLT